MRNIQKSNIIAAIVELELGMSIFTHMLYSCICCVFCIIFEKAHPTPTQKSPLKIKKYIRNPLIELFSNFNVGKSAVKKVKLIALSSLTRHKSQNNLLAKLHHHRVILRAMLCYIIHHFYISRNFWQLFSYVCIGWCFRYSPHR